MQIKIKCIKNNIILTQSSIGQRLVKDDKKMKDDCRNHSFTIVDRVAIVDPRNSAMQQRHYSGYFNNIDNNKGR